MKHLIVFITAFLFFSITARAGDFKVLWETTMAGTSGNPRVTDDGKYFFYEGGGYLNVFDSETGIFLHKLKLGESSNRVIEKLNYTENKVVLIYSLDSIMIYNIVSNEIEDIINLNYNITVSNIREVSLSPNKRYLSLACYFNEQRHLIIVDMLEKKLYKDLKLTDYIEQIFNTNDPNRMIVVTSNQHGKHLFEMTLDETATFGFRSKMIEEVSEEDSKIRMEKYDADEDAIYYLYLPEDLGKRLSKYEFQKKKVTNLYEGGLADENLWFSDDNNIILFGYGYFYSLNNKEWYGLRQVDNYHQATSSCDGLKTVLLRVQYTIKKDTLRRFDVSDLITDVQTGNEENNYIYPNPTTGILNINLLNKFPDYFRYNLISDSGQSILSNDIGFLNAQNSNLSIDIKSIPVGHYILHINSDRERFEFSIIKEN